MPQAQPRVAGGAMSRQPWLEPAGARDEVAARRDVRSRPPRATSAVLPVARRPPWSALPRKARANLVGAPPLSLAVQPLECFQPSAALPAGARAQLP